MSTPDYTKYGHYALGGVIAAALDRVGDASPEVTLWHRESLAGAFAEMRRRCEKALAEPSSWWERKPT